MKLVNKTSVGQRRVYDIEVEGVHNFYANGVNVHNCATDGGVSVIKDDGTVVDIVYSGSPVITSVDMTPERMFFSATNGVVIASGYPTSDVSSSSFSTLAGLLPDGAGYYISSVPANLGVISKVVA
jgi:hypothetical protein